MANLLRPSSSTSSSTSLAASVAQPLSSLSSLPSHTSIAASLVAALGLFASLAPLSTHAAPVPLEAIENLAGGVASSVQVSSVSGAAVSIAQAVSPSEVRVRAIAPTNTSETAFYVIERGDVGGFVVMSADDRLEPFLVIAPSGSFDDTPGTPLYDLLCGDVDERMAGADETAASRSAGWRSLLAATSPPATSSSGGDDGLAAYIARDGVQDSEIDDVRVAPLVQSKWNQSTVGGKNVYNYYTPNNYVCGCVATAASQILRKWKFQKGKAPSITRTCSVSGVSIDKTTYGGTYEWDNMPLVPTSAIGESECQAIGKLCYDVGVTVYMSWGSGGSGAPPYILPYTFCDVFGYRNAIAWQQQTGSLSETAIEKAILANLDAGYPVELGISSSRGGHSIVADGYGYKKDTGALYVHLNLGWGGSYDAWYNLPNVGTSYQFNVVNGTVYNIFPEKSGDLLTGRVVDEATGLPIEGATVQASDGTTVAGTATTNAKGIYALCLNGDTTYSVVASAAGAETATLSVYLPKSVSVRTSGESYYLNTGYIGNSWGNDFSLAMATEPEAPEAPEGVSASDGTSTELVRVTWRASSGATYYMVYRAESNSPAAAQCIAPSVSTPYYDDRNVNAGTTYFYWIVAGNSSGTSGYSTSDSGWRAYTRPAAPTGVSATDGTSTAGVTVTWNAVDSATSYSMLRGDTVDSSAAQTLASGLTATTYTDTTAEPGVTYFYWVTATNQGGTSDCSEYDEGSRAVSRPSAPTGVSASDGLSATEIVVTWNAVASATSYSVYRGTTTSASAASLLASGLTVTSYVDTTAAAGTTYRYWVKASNAGGESPFSSPGTGSLAEISGPASVSASDGTFPEYVRVTWTASQNASSYEVWRGASSAYSQAANLADASSTQYDDASAVPGTRYWYWVRSKTTDDKTSEFSASDSGFRPLAVPTGVSATTGNAAGVTVKWAAVTGATSYKVGRGALGASEPSDVFDSTTSRSYLDATAVPGVRYAYFVRAVSSACESPWSASATGSRSIPMPSGLWASDGDYSDRIQLTWPELSGAESYELARSPENDISLAETIAETSATSYSDASVEYGVVYYYFLRAKFAAGTSAWSASEPGNRAFPKPTGVSASDGGNTARITVTWNAIDGASFYQVWRYSVERSRNELIGTSSTASYNDNKNIEPGVKYSYQVVAIFPTGTSKPSDSDTGYMKASSPTPVATDGASASQITVTWTAMPGARTYLVYRGETSTAADAVRIGSTSMLFYEDKTASKGTLYYYWVVTATALDTSDFGSSDTGYRGLAGATGVKATDGRYSDRVDVTWSAVSGAVSYEVWRGTSDDPAAASRVARNVKETSWSDTGVTPGQKCWYWVRACDVGPGLWGTSDSGWRILEQPSDIAATTNQTDGVKVTWKGTTSGVWFEIRRGLSDDRSESTVIATVESKANYLDDTAVPGTIYYYWVQGYSELSTSAWSASAWGYRAISVPATVSATDGTSLDSVTLTWTAATAAKSYQIWRGVTTKPENAEIIGTTNKLVWVDTDVEPGVAYSYWIKSVSAIDISAFSARETGYASTLPPSDVTASDGASPSYVRVDWTAADGALSYAVWRAESENEAAASEIKTGISVAPYDDATVTPGKFYWYWVRPVSAAGPGIFAGPDSGYASLAAPVDVIATSNSERNVTVSWKRVNGAVSYEIFRAETDDVADATNSVLATVEGLSYADTNAFPAVRYWYWVRARADAGVSPFGGPADGFRLISVPQNVAASDGISAEHVGVTWSESIGATGYEVWRAENSTSTAAASLIATTNSLEYLDADAAAGVSYTYWVKAVSDVYTTGFSANDKGWRSPKAPDGVEASNGTSPDGIVVKWLAVEGALKYEIWRNRTDEATTNGASRVATTADAATLFYTDTGANPGIRYWYWVRTVAAPGTGVFSEADDGWRALAVPANLKAADGASYDYVRITWGKVTGAESYEVARWPANSESPETETEIFPSAAVTFDDALAEPGTLYSYRVRAVSSLSNGDWSDSDTGYRKLQKITDVAASDGESTDAVFVSWTVPGGAEKCQIWRSTGNSVSTASKIGEAAESPYADASALHGVKYFYWVNAVSDVEGEMGSYNDGWRGLLPPESIQATDGDSTSHTRITWSPSPDATTYEVLRGDSPDPAAMKSLRTLSSPSELAWEDTTGTAGSNYWYSVRAGGTGGWSAPGEPDSGYKALTPPSSVSATDGTQAGKVTVKWGTVTGARFYQVYRADSADGEKSPWSGWQTQTTFVDTSCRGGVRYWYYVVAAADETGARPSTYSAGDSGYAKDDGSQAEPVSFGGGISWPVSANSDGSTTTNEISFSSIEGGRLTFSGVYGAVGSKATVKALVKPSLSAEPETIDAQIEIVSPGTAELDLESVWGERPSLFIIGIEPSAD